MPPRAFGDEKSQCKMLRMEENMNLKRKLLTRMDKRRRSTSRRRTARTSGKSFTAPRLFISGDALLKKTIRNNALNTNGFAVASRPSTSAEDKERPTTSLASASSPRPRTSTMRPSTAWSSASPTGTSLCTYIFKKDRLETARSRCGSLEC